MHRPGLRSYIPPLAASALAFFSVFLISHSAHAAGETATATPSSGLTNGQSITVSGGGFPASASLAVVECSAAAPDAAGSQCNIGGVTFATATASGSFSTAFTVKTGAIGTGTCAANSTCYVFAATVDKAHSAVATIQFGTGASSSSPPAPASSTQASSGHAAASTSAAATNHAATSSAASTHSATPKPHTTSAAPATSSHASSSHAAEAVAVDPSPSASAAAANAEDLAFTGSHDLKWLLIGGAALLYIGYMALTAGTPGRGKHRST
jgi:hypothetical protein